MFLASASSAGIGVSYPIPDSSSLVPTRHDATDRKAHAILGIVSATGWQVIREQRTMVAQMRFTKHCWSFGVASQQAFPGGILNLTGVRPGEAFQYQGLAFPDMTIYMVFFTTTYDAIQKLILPPPLQADRSLPPQVQMWYFNSRNTRPMDGRITPYQGFQFRAATEFNGVKGSAGWEYIDGLYGDKTECDIMGPWGVYFGMLKKMADIRFTPLSVDEFEMTVTRRGVRLITIRMRIGAEMNAEQVARMNDGNGGETLTVREVPDINYTGFVDRAVCATPTNVTNRVLRAWSAGNAAVQFGHLELDPLDELEVLRIDSAIAFTATASVETFTQMRVLANLPRISHHP